MVMRRTGHKPGGKDENMKKYGFSIKAKNKKEERLILQIILNGLQTTKANDDEENTFIQQLWVGVISTICERRDK